MRVSLFSHLIFTICLTYNLVSSASPPATAAQVNLATEAQLNNGQDLVAAAQLQFPRQQQRQQFQSSSNSGKNSQQRASAGLNNVGQFNKKSSFSSSSTTKGNRRLGEIESNDFQTKGQRSHDQDKYRGDPFAYSYNVNNQNGTQFSSQKESDGQIIRGEYRVLLPDGRLQIVKYVADWKNGYQAEVSYVQEERKEEPRKRLPIIDYQAKQSVEIETEILPGGFTPPTTMSTTEIPIPTTMTTTTTEQPRSSAAAGLYGATSAPHFIRFNPKFGYPVKIAKKKRRRATGNGIPVAPRAISGYINYYNLNCKKSLVRDNFFVCE